MTSGRAEAKNAKHTIFMRGIAAGTRVQYAVKQKMKNSYSMIHH
jgi:hypothetical protein